MVENVLEPGAQTQEPGAPPVGQEPQTPEETFSREYVESLRKEAASHRTKAKELETRLKEMESSLPTQVEEKAREYLEQLYQQYYGQNPYMQQNPSYQGYDPYSPLTQKLTDLENRFKTLEERLSDSLPKVYEQELDNLLAGLKSKYPEMDEEVVMARILAYGDLSPEELEEVAKASHEKYAGLKDKIISEYLESKKKPSPPLGASIGPALGTPSIKPEEMDWEAAHEAAKEALRRAKEEE